jgi:ribosomal protein S20
VFAQRDFSFYRDNGNTLETNFYKKLSTNVKNNRGNYTGSPFLEETLELGTLILNGGDAQVFFMRYNVLEQRIEFSDTNDVETLKMLPKEDNILIQLRGKTYQYLHLGNLPTGYYEIAKTFDEDRLLLVQHKKIIYEVERRNSYNSSQKSQIKSSEKMYFLDNKDAIEIENHKKHSVKAFPKSTQSVLKTYIKENKIKFNDDYKGLIALLNKYMTL